MIRAALLCLIVACGGSPPPPSSHVTPPAAHSHADHTGGGMHHKFTNAEDWVKVFDDPARDAWQEPDRVVAELALTPTMIVADIGAGTGYFTVRLARAVPEGRVIATDLEPDMVRYLAARAQREGLANIEAVVTPADDPRLAPASVDRILVADVWHHVDGRVVYARKLAAALRPGGTITIVDFKLDATRGPPAKFRLAPDAVIAELASAGLTARVAFVLADQYVITARAAR